MLGQFNLLEPMVRLSLLPAEVPAPAVIPAPFQFDTHRPEYKPALQDSSIIQALLEFHHAAQAQATRESVPKATRFTARQIPKVQVTPKPVSRQKNSGVFQSLQKQADLK